MVFLQSAFDKEKYSLKPEAMQLQQFLCTLIKPPDEGLSPTKDGGTCLRRLNMFRKEVH